jgi:hypothetical protein
VTVVRKKRSIGFLEAGELVDGSYPISGTVIQ